MPKSTNWWLRKSDENLNLHCKSSGCESCLSNFPKFLTEIVISYIKKSCTSIPLNSIGQVGHSRQRRRVSKRIGRKGKLTASGVSFDDLLVSSPEERTGDPFRGRTRVILHLRHDCGEISGCVLFYLLMLLVCESTRSRAIKISLI